MLWGRPSRSPRSTSSVERRYGTNFDSRKASSGPRHWLPIQPKVCLGNVGMGGGLSEVSASVLFVLVDLELFLRRIVKNLGGLARPMPSLVVAARADVCDKL